VVRMKECELALRNRRDSLPGSSFVRVTVRGQIIKVLFRHSIPAECGNQIEKTTNNVVVFSTCKNVRKGAALWAAHKN